MGVESVRYSLVLELLHDLRQLVRHGQSNPSSILHNADALVGAVEEDDCRAKDAPAAYHMDIEDVRHAYQCHDEHLLADAFEAN